IFGTSRHLHVGPSSTVAALSFSVVAGLGVAVGSEEWVVLTMMLALVTGVLLILGSLLRLGILADFFSRPVLAGFIVGVAITIAVGQLDKLLGYEVDDLRFIPEILVIIANFGQVHWATLTVGLVSLALLFLMHRYTPKIPAALTVVLLAIILSSLLDFESMGIHIVGAIPAGLPDFGLPQGIQLSDIYALLPGAAAIALVAFAESVAAARSYALKYDYKINPDQELMAIGAANLGSGLSGSFVVDGSVSRTAAADSAGAKSQMVSIIIAAMVLITMLFLTPLFHNLPEATLGAIVIHAVWHLISWKKVSIYRNITSLDFWTAVVALVGVLMLGILEGLVLAIGLGLLGLLVGTKSRTTSVLGKVPDENVYRSLEHYPDGETYPGLLIVRFDGSLFFANAPDFAEEIREGVKLFEPSVVLVDGESISDIDATAIATFSDLHAELQR
ncbi:MAG: SulP family inorganic anion transporter, partial [Chloroflexi bacterium]|nr:SulP family inorganic anion transporter [Chloroflexota bacterium]